MDLAMAIQEVFVAEEWALPEAKDAVKAKDTAEAKDVAKAKDATKAKDAAKAKDATVKANEAEDKSKDVAIAKDAPAFNPGNKEDLSPSSKA
nr:hypothetical protein CFP56_39470 [Quercus suber]